MKRLRFTEEQIIGILREQEAGAPVMDLCREHGLSSPTGRARGEPPGDASVEVGMRAHRLFTRIRLAAGLSGRRYLVGQRTFIVGADRVILTYGPSLMS